MPTFVKKFSQEQKGNKGRKVKLNIKNFQNIVSVAKTIWKWAEW